MKEEEAAKKAAEAEELKIGKENINKNKKTDVDMTANFDAGDDADVVF